MIEIVLWCVLAFVQGGAFGYGLCRHLLYGIAVNEAGRVMANRIFGRVEPPADVDLDGGFGL